ncbi:MAG: hypothetical protein VYE73_10940 [Acidobacteriota bacterium]|nr:hypothetical protein [Acidobacteriota bacterium]
MRTGIRCPRRPRGIDLWGIAAAALLCAPLLAQDPLDAGRKWRRVRAGDLIVTSDAAPLRVTELTHDLVANRATLHALLGADSSSSTPPTEIFVFRKLLDFEPYNRTPAGKARPEGVLTARDRRGRIIAFTLGAGEGALPAARALIAGDTIDRLLPNPPEWIRTGLVATFAALEPAQPPTHLDDSPKAPFSAPPSIWPAGLDIVTDPLRRNTVFVAMTRYLIQGDSGRSAQLRRYLRLLRGRTPDNFAFEESFLAPRDFVYAEIKAAAGRGYRLEVSLEASSAPAIDDPEEIPRDLLNLKLGELVARTSPWNTVGAALHYAEIPEDSPLYADAVGGEAYLRGIDNRHGDALDLYRQALAKGSEAPAIGLLYGWRLLERFRREVGTFIAWEESLPAEIAEARKAFTRARVDATDNPYLLHGIGATHLFSAADPSPGVTALERAHRALPNDIDILADWIVGLAHADRGDEAMAMFEQRLALIATDEVLRRTRRYLLEEELRRITLRVQRGDLDGAEVSIRKARVVTTDPATRADLDTALEQIDALRRQSVVDEQIERFEAAGRAVRNRVQARDFEGARNLIRPFMEPETDPGVRARATLLLGEVNALER